MHNFGKIGGTVVCITNHALDRMCEMGITGDVVRDILTNPEAREVSHKSKGVVLYRRGCYTLPTKVDRQGCLIVVTALFASKEDWDAAITMGMVGVDRLAGGYRSPKDYRTNA